jgi:nitroreductase
MKKPASTDVPIHDLLRERWSPRAFSDKPVEPETLHRLFEAARWAPSSNNTQPWAYIMATKDDKENFDKVLSTMVEFNQGWAKNAPVIGLSVAQVVSQDGKNLRHAFHDVGSASAQLTVQAVAEGLFVHQMGGIEPEKARQVFHIPSGWEAVAGIALGYPGDPNTLSEKLRQRELAPRTRKPLSEFVMTGDWGHTATILS